MAIATNDRNTTDKKKSLFLWAEKLAKDSALFPDRAPTSVFGQIAGLVSKQEVAKTLDRLKAMKVDDYIAEVLDPAEDNSRTSAKSIVKMFPGRLYNEVDDGPLYIAEVELQVAGANRRVGIIAQNRAVKNGVWGPEHHLSAAKWAREFNSRAMPIVTFMDTPGADAGEEANSNNQAHSISRMIAEMTNATVPSVGIVYGLGYSGGAIPLASTNVLLAVKSAAFNTIQPKGLANIARQYNLSWQECARYVGVSPCELMSKKIIDGVVDWKPEDADAPLDPLVNAITSAIAEIENSSLKYINDNPQMNEHYALSIDKRLHLSEDFLKVQSISSFGLAYPVTEAPNIFRHTIRFMRYLGLRRRISSSTLGSYGRLAEEEIPTGDLAERQRHARDEAFEQWHDDPDKIVYHDQLLKAWTNFRQKRAELSNDRGRITTLLLGTPQKNYEEARQAICFEVALYLYNRWKGDSEYNFARLEALVTQNEYDEKTDQGVYRAADNDVTVSDVIYLNELKEEFSKLFVNMLIFDALYNSIVNNFAEIAKETRHSHVISNDSLQNLLDSTVVAATEKASKVTVEVSGNATKEIANPDDLSVGFGNFLRYFGSYRRRGNFLKDVEEWKRVMFPRLSESLLVLLTFFFENTIPDFLLSRTSGKAFSGEINPVRIGKRKDFWNQLDIAYNDLLVQRVLDGVKRSKVTTVDAFKERFFEEFEETNADVMTANPVSFPGFRISIEKALSNKVTPCGVVTGVGRLNFGEKRKVGVVISNVAFQAGAFDMASGEKMCRMLALCVKERMPLVCFVSSGGMQTKEGPNALFSMAIVNDRITRFVADNDLPVIVFGFGDCTGGSQASFVTHPLAQTYYFSGTDLPFAGRVVVPSFLPSNCTVANYLRRVPGSMRGLVTHPLVDDLDAQLRAVDPNIPVPSETVEDVVERVFAGAYLPDESELDETIRDGEAEAPAVVPSRPIERVLIHARGCTAVKLIRIAQKLEKQVVLVQSDPDMESVPAAMLTKKDELVCIGGQTPDESYLNANSIVAIAGRRSADSLHPGIGFLSENADFARMCNAHDLNFVGPLATSMDTMGNKSNAIHTAMSNNVPVVPGSHGILTNVSTAIKVAEEVGYPVLLKAVHGGGGKGIKVVRDPADMRESFFTVCTEAKSAFGNGDVYMEKFVESMRHIEVQVLRDTHGNTKILGLRDCSVQRNNQKVLEESASTMLPEKLEKQAYECAEKLANAVDYRGAGTVEFIYDLKNDAIYFMEMNTRLQVEHPVTEWTTDISVVSNQFKIAEGESIKDMEINRKGFAIEARITAEKAVSDSAGEIDFVPTPGLITECKIPEGEGIEVIATVAKGKTVSPFYDSMIAQVICYGKDREDAHFRLLAVLEKTVIKGVCTNIPLLKRVLCDDVFKNGVYDTGYLPKFLASTDREKLIEEMADSGVKQMANDASALKIEGTEELKVPAPMTGIYYATPSPSEPEYVSVGARIDSEKTICQIEAMKLFSPVTLSSVSPAFEEGVQYEVVRISQTGGAQVNQGDLLFVVKPVK